MVENAHWAQRMPWRLIGFGAAFIAALLVWHSQRDATLAKYDSAMTNAETVFDAADALEDEDELVEEEVVAASAQPTLDEEEEESELTLAIATEETTVVEQSAVFVEPAPRPQRLVVLVQHRAPAQAPPRHYGLGGPPAGYGITPPNRLRPQLLPSGPTTPRSARLPSRRPQTRPARRAGGGMIASRSPRKTSSRRRKLGPR